MRRCVEGACVLAMLVTACRGGGEGGAPPPPPGDAKSTVGDPPVKATEPEKKPDPCGAAALGLGAATALPAWTPHDGCTASGHGNELVRDAAGLSERLQCPAGAESAFDFSRGQLLSVAYTLSPAGAGVQVYDDGKALTVVTRQRTPCPGGPMPMPMSVTAWFRVPAGERTIGAAICTIESTCN